MRKMQGILNAIKAIMGLRTSLQGYKTYILLAGAILTGTAAFINTLLVPYIDGTIGLNDLLMGIAALLAGSGLLTAKIGQNRLEKKVDGLAKK